MRLLITILLGTILSVYVYILLKKIIEGTIYKTIIQILVSFGVGIFTVILLNSSSPNIESSLTVLLLWLAWLGTIWTARETFDQKQIANKTIQEIKKQVDLEIRPYLRLHWVGEESNILEIVNEGRGIALDVIFDRTTFTNGGFITPLQIQSRPLISPGGVTGISRQELVFTGDVEHIDLRNRSMYIFLDSQIKYGYKIGCTYKDVIDNKYEAIFISDETYKGRFKIERQVKIYDNRG